MCISAAEIISGNASFTNGIMFCVNNTYKHAYLLIFSNWISAFFKISNEILASYKSTPLNAWINLKSRDLKSMSQNNKYIFIWFKCFLKVSSVLKHKNYLKKTFKNGIHTQEWTNVYLYVLSFPSLFSLRIVIVVIPIYLHQTYKLTWHHILWNNSIMRVNCQTSISLYRCINPWPTST